MIKQSTVIEKIKNIQNIYGQNIKIDISGQVAIGSESLVKVTFIRNSTGKILNEKELRLHQQTNNYNPHDIQDLYSVSIELFV